MAVLGIRAEGHVAAFTVPEYAQRSGITIIPVPVYHPDITEILGEPVVRRVADAPPPIDLVDVFRRSEDIPPHLDDIIAAKPRAVWFQLGIRNDAAAERLARAGILVVQDRCVHIELMRMGR
jgi:predicted CoA-binding protein